MHEVYTALDALEAALREREDGAATGGHLDHSARDEVLTGLSVRAVAELKRPAVCLYGPSHARSHGMELSEKPERISVWQQFGRSMPRVQGVVRRHPVAVVGGVIVVTGVCWISWWPLVIPLGLAALVVLAYLKERQITWNFGEEITHELSEPGCTACGYDLGAFAPAIDPARLEGLNAGPRVCPECGQRWPFIVLPM